MSFHCPKSTGTSYALIPITGRLRSIPEAVYEWRVPLTLEELRADVESGEIDTVLLVMTDMQGRLQGKRLHAPFFCDEVAAHGAEGCYYLLTVDVDMMPVQGFEMASWILGIPGLILSYYTAVTYVPTIRKSLREGRETAR